MPAYCDSERKKEYGPIDNGRQSPDSPAVACEDQYMFGPDLLVAPIFSLGEREREVYLPAGFLWTDINTGAQYTGGQTILAPAPLEWIPVFRKA